MQPIGEYVAKPLPKLALRKIIPGDFSKAVDKEYGEFRFVLAKEMSFV